MNPEQQVQRTYSVLEAARELRLSRSQVYWLANTRQIGHCRIGRRITFTDAHLTAFLEAHEQPPVGAYAAAAAKLR